MPWHDKRLLSASLYSIVNLLAEAGDQELLWKDEMRPNKPDAVNPAIAPRFAVVHHWRRVTDPERSPEVVGTCRVTVPLWLRFFRFSETAQSEVIYGK